MLRKHIGGNLIFPSFPQKWRGKQMRGNFSFFATRDLMVRMVSIYWPSDTLTDDSCHSGKVVTAHRGEKPRAHLSSSSSSVAIIISILHPVWQSLNKCSVITPLAIWIQHLTTLNLVACSSSDIGLNSYTISTRECESKTFEFLIGNFERGGWHHSQTTRRRTRPHILPRNLHIIFPELLYNSDLERTEQEENTHLT